MKKFIKQQQASSKKKKEKTELVAVTAVHLLWDAEPIETTYVGETSGDDSSQESDGTTTADIYPVKV